jgi:drug/metabolite transporter, DME family
MADMNIDPLRGVALILLAAALWGTTGTAQGLAEGSLPAVWFGALRLLVAALFFVVLTRLTASKHGVSRVERGRAWWACAGAGLCMAVYNLAFFAGIRVTGVALGTAVALGSGPLWAGVLQALLQRRWPALSWWLGTVLAVAGGALMGGIGAAAPVRSDAGGLVLCMLAGLSYAAYTLLTKRLADTLPASTVTLRAFAVAAAVALSVAAWSSGAPAGLSWREAGAVLYLGVFATGVAYLLFGLALCHVSAATGVTLALFEPVMACLLATVVLGEAVGAGAWSGLALVLSGVFVVVRAELTAPLPARAGVMA